MSKRKRSHWFVAAAAVVILGGFSYLVYGGIESNLVYFLTPSELKDKGEAAFNEPVRLGGQVVPGSVEWNAETIDLRFKLTDGTSTLTVYSSKAPPQMFREGMGVVVEGELTADGVFKSDNLMVKHSNEYKAPHGDGPPPKEMYESILRGS